MLTEYEASQRQRQIERNIRKYKREYLALDAAGKPTDGAAAKLAKWQSLQKDFIKQTGMKRQYNRERVIKPVDNPLESGIIKESNTKPIANSTDSAIDRVPKIESSGYSDEQNDYIQHQHKELLKFARDKNDSKEVAFVFDSNLGNRREYIGTDDRLDFGSVLYGKDLFVMHNHPRNSSYSMNDLYYILNNDQIKSLSIIKNNGSVEILMKTSEYDKVRMQVALRRAVKKNLKMDILIS